MEYWEASIIKKKSNGSKCKVISSLVTASLGFTHHAA